MTPEKRQTIFFLIPVTARIALENEAFRKGVSMSWVIRSLVAEYRRGHSKTPDFRRPARLQENHVRFGLVLYGNKTELLSFARANGGEFSAFIRWLLNQWMNGKLTPDLNSSKTVKNLKSAFYRFTGFASVKPVKEWYRAHEFRPKNPATNIALMKRGLSRRFYFPETDW